MHSIVRYVLLTSNIVVLISNIVLLFSNTVLKRFTMAEELCCQLIRKYQMRDSLLAQINTVSYKPLQIPYNTTDGCSKRDIGIG